jgi:hypothetical protein
MKKIIELIRAKERDEKAPSNAKKTTTKAEKQLSAEAPSTPQEAPPHDLFWDDYSDVGYC